MSGLGRANMLLSAGRRRGRPVGTGRRSGNGGSRRRMALPGRGGRKRTHGIRTGRRRGRSLFRRRRRFMPHGSGNILRMSSRSGRQASGQKKSRAVASGRTRIRDLRNHHAGVSRRRSDLLRPFRMPRPARHYQFTIRSQRSGKHPPINATGALHEEAGAEPACRGGDHRPDRDDTDDGPHSRQVPQA